jgi:hypothetical protein
MSLSDLASLGSFASGIAVLTSLIFLYFQLRQMNQQGKQIEKNQQAMIREERTTRTVDITRRRTDRAFTESFVRVLSASEDISAVDLHQFDAFHIAFFYNWEDAFYQHHEGLFSELAFSALDVNVREILRLMPVRAQWRLWRHQYGPEFVAWIDNLIAQTPPSKEGSDPIRQWKDAMAAERSGTPI